MPHDVEALLSELKFLRKKVRDLEQHHKCCSIVLSPVDDESGTELQIIPFSPLSTNSKPHNAIPRWKPIADDILQDALSPEQWMERRRDLGLATTEGATWLSAMILGAPTQVFGQRASQHADGVMVSAQIYAKSTRAAQGYSDVFYQVQYFMELVLFSLCAVLDNLGYPEGEINETMRICLSNSEDINLRRLRRGALWVNGIIAEMCEAGVGGNRTELFFIYGVPTWKYSILADNTDSRKHFLEILLGEGSKLPRDDSQKGVPTFFIPAYIKALLGDGATLSQICDALCYGSKHATESTIKLCERYRDLAWTGSSEPLIILSQRGKKRQRDPGSTTAAQKRRRKSINATNMSRLPTSIEQGCPEVTVFPPQHHHPFLGSQSRGSTMHHSSDQDPFRDNTNSIGVLLNAAEHIAGSVSCQQLPLIESSSIANQIGLTLQSPERNHLFLDGESYASDWGANSSGQPLFWIDGGDPLDYSQPLFWIDGRDPVFGPEFGIFNSVTQNQSPMQYAVE